MARISTESEREKARPWVSGAVLLAFALVAAIWAASHFSAEARVRRATARVVRLAEKTGPEAPVALGLAAHRFGNFLATNAVLEVEDWQPLATGRTEIVQVFAQLREALARIEFENPEIAVAVVRRGEVRAVVKARYRLAPESGAAAEGAGTAELQWIKGKDGWQILRATLQAEEGAKLPEGWR